MADRVRRGAARTGAWAGSGWTGASAGPCDLAAASPVRSARQTSACRRASSGGRRKCCSRFPLCAPWTCSSGCTSPVIRGRSTERLMWGEAWLGRAHWAMSLRPTTEHKMCCCSKIQSRCLLDLNSVAQTQLKLSSTPQKRRRSKHVEWGGERATFWSSVQQQHYWMWIMRGHVRSHCTMDEPRQADRPCNYSPSVLLHGKAAKLDFLRPSESHNLE